MIFSIKHRGRYEEILQERKIEQVKVDKKFQTRVCAIVDKITEKAVKRVMAQKFKRCKLKRYSKDKILFIRGELCRLPAVEFAVVYLKYWEGYDLNEIASNLGLSYYTVDLIVRSGIRRLRQKYKEKYKQYLILDALKCA